MVMGYCLMIQQYERRAFNSSQVQSTAIGLFQRFFFKRNFHENNPIKIMKTVIVLAAKIEELDFDPQMLEQVLDFKANEYSKYERVVLEQLDFSVHFLNLSLVFSEASERLGVAFSKDSY